MATAHKVAILEQKDESAQQVEWDDQQKINRFSACSSLADVLSERLEKMTSELDDLEELDGELELCDDEYVK